MRALIATPHRGKCVVIAGAELFAADTPEEAWALATTAHPEDDGSFIRYIPREKVPRIYLVDQPGNIVCLLGQRHRYTILQD